MISFFKLQATALSLGEELEEGEEEIIEELILYNINKRLEFMVSRL
jgi:hypothetical protein